MRTVTTTHGEMDEALLRKVEGSLDNETETTSWVEYHLGDELVHRSVNMQLKQSVFSQASAASIG